MNKIRLIPPKLRKSSLSKPLWQLIRPYALCAVLLSLCQVMIQAQISTIVFEDDFSSNAIHPATYEASPGRNCAAHQLATALKLDYTRLWD